MQKNKRPNFRLERFSADGSRQRPEMYALADLDSGWRMGRRGFVFTAVAGLAAGLGLIGCRDRDEADGPLIGAACPANIRAHLLGVGGVAFSGNGARMLSVGLDVRLKLWEMPSGKLLRNIRAHEKAIHAVCFHPNGSQLATGAVDRRIKIWELTGNNLVVVKTLETETPIRALAYSPDGTKVVSTSFTGGLMVWDPASGEGKPVPDIWRPITAMAFHPDGRRLVVAEDDQPAGMVKAITTLDSLTRQIRIIDVETLEVVRQLGWPRAVTYVVGSQTHYSTLAISPDGAMLAAGHDTTMDLWNLDAMQKTASLPAGSTFPDGDDANIDAVAFSPTGRWLAALYVRETDLDMEVILELWDVAAGTRVKTLARTGEKKPAAMVNNEVSICFSPDETLLVGGFPDGSIRVWDLPSGTPLTCLFDPKITPKDVQVAQYGARTAAGRPITVNRPCGEPSPPGAICTCNCVAGAATQSSGGTRDATGACTCNQICTCVPIK